MTIFASSFIFYLSYNSFRIAIAEAVTILNIEHKIKLWKLLDQEITEAQSVTRNNIDTTAIDSLDRIVEKVLLETGMTEDELVEAFVNQES